MSVHFVKVFGQDLNPAQIVNVRVARRPLPATLRWAIQIAAGLVCLAVLFVTIGASWIASIMIDAGMTDDPLLPLLSMFGSDVGQMSRDVLLPLGLPLIFIILLAASALQSLATRRDRRVVVELTHGRALGPPCAPTAPPRSPPT